MKKKLVSSIIFLSIIFFVGCQRSYTGNNKERENLKIEKKEKLKECTITEFYNGIAKKDWRDLSIIQLTDDKITVTISHYFWILGKTKGKYKISKIIDLHPYNVDSYYSEESTEFYPSQDTKRYLIYNECYINKKDQVILAKENKNLNSILIDFEKDEVKYLKGNEFYKYWNNNKGAGSTKGLKASKSTFKDIGLADLIEKKPKSAVTHTVIVTGYKPLSAKKMEFKRNSICKNFRFL